MPHFLFHHHRIGIFGIDVGKLSENQFHLGGHEVFSQNWYKQVFLNVKFL